MLSFYIFSQRKQRLCEFFKLLLQNGRKKGRSNKVELTSELYKEKLLSILKFVKMREFLMLMA